LTPDQAAKLKRDIRRLTRKIGRRKPDHPSMPGLQQQLAELQRELNGEASPTSSPSPAPEPVSSPPALTPDQAAKLKRDIRRLTRKIGRRKPDHPSMPGLQQQLAELQRELNGEASPTSSVSARLGSKASIVVSTRDLDVSRAPLFCVVAVTIVGIVIRRLRRAPEFETDEIARLL
jgi:ribosomal protein S15P/S13E